MIFRNFIQVALIATSLSFGLSQSATGQVETQTQEPQKDEVSQAVEKLSALLYHIDRSYVDSVDTDKIVEEAIEEMLAELDPHSIYISPDELKKMNEPLRGNFEGIGIRFNIIKDTIVVVSPISGGPSEALGIQSGDKIVEIDGEDVGGIGITNRGVADRLRGPKDTEVTVGIHRKGANDLLYFDIIRDKIPLHSVDASYMAEPGIGYIKVNRFSANMMEEFYSAMDELQKEGMQDLVLDLQGNGGGYLKAAIQMADVFLEAGRLIVYTEGRSYSRKNTFASDSGRFETGRLVVLIDEGSASASEIVSGAVQDWDRGLIIGRRSFGKGLVQRPISLPDGSAIRLTIQKYYTPSGRCIQKPFGEDLEAYKMEKYERYESGELFTADSIDLPDSLKYYTENNRVVYGGGGIMPDIFVPVDTTNSSDLNTNLIRKGVFNTFAITYVNENRKNLKKAYKSVEVFEDDFEIDQELFDEFLAYAEKEDVEYDEEQFNRSEEMIRGRLKAHLARNIYDYSAYYQVFNPYWPAYQKAIEVLQSDEFSKFKLAEHKD